MVSGGCGGGGEFGEYVFDIRGKGIGLGWGGVIIVEVFNENAVLVWFCWGWGYFQIFAAIMPLLLLRRSPSSVRC